MSSSDIDYRAIEVPEEKDHEDYHYTERRAQLLQAIEAAGSPRRLNYASLGRRYGVTRETIRYDVERLGEWLDNHRDGPTATLEGESFLWNCARSLLEDEEYRKAAQTWLDLAEWRRQSDLDDLLERVEALEAERTSETTNPFQLK